MSTTTITKEQEDSNRAVFKATTNFNDQSLCRFCLLNGPRCSDRCIHCYKMCWSAAENPEVHHAEWELATSRELLMEDLLLIVNTLFGSKENACLVFLGAIVLLSFANAIFGSCF